MPQDSSNHNPNLDPLYDEKMGRAWVIEDEYGRQAANAFLLEQGLQALPESDSK